MSSTEILVRSLAGIVLLLGNAFFVAAEFGLTRLRQLDDDVLADDRLDRALRLTERLEIYLTSCQVGITTTSILLGVVWEPAVTTLLRPAVEWMQVPERALPATSVLVAVIVINLFHTVWGEQTPTYLGVERPAQVARWSATPLRAWTVAIYPLIWAGDRLSKATLGLFGIRMRRSWMDEADGDAGGSASVAEMHREMGEILSRGELSEERRQEVLNSLAIETLPLRDIVVPRDEVVALRADASYEELLEILTEHRFSRYPMIGETLEDFRGVLYVPALVGFFEQLRNGEIDLESLATESLRLEAETTVSRAIDEFQDANQELALVFDDERVIGLVTVTDALEQIAGDLEDPFD